MILFSYHVRLFKPPIAPSTAISPFLVWVLFLALLFYFTYKVLTNPSPDTPLLLSLLLLIFVLMGVVYFWQLVQIHMYISCYLKLFASIGSIMPPVPDQRLDTEDTAPRVPPLQISLYQWVILPLILWFLLLVSIIFFGYRRISTQEASPDDPLFYKILLLACLLICLVFVFLLWNIHKYIIIYLQISHAVANLAPMQIPEDNWPLYEA